MGDFDYKEWYAENKEERNRRRRERYRNDPEYRERVLAPSRKRRRRKRRKRLNAKKVFRMRTTHRLYTEAVDADGNEVGGVFYTRLALTSVLDVSKRTVIKWIDQGRIPEPPYRSSAGYYLYPLEMIEDLCERRETIKQFSYKDPAGKHYHGEREITRPDGRKVTSPMYTTGMVAKALGVNPAYVLQLTNKGVLPDTPYKFGRHRAYTSAMVRAVARVILDDDSLQTVDRDWDAIGRRILKRWQELGAAPDTQDDRDEQRQNETGRTQ